MQKSVGLILFIAFSLNISAQSRQNRSLIFFFDGLRPDYITAELMPNLYAFSSAAAYGRQHHSVYPTVTRVNAASYTTGSYPGTHGLMGNEVYFPTLDSIKGISTSRAKNLQSIDAATGGHLLTAQTLGEVLKSADKQLMVFSSGSTGQAFLQNPKICGAIVNPELILPESFKDIVYQRLGQPPADSTPNTPRHKWITDALIAFGLVENGPLVSAIWLSDPDGAAHDHGIGSPQATASLHAVDAQFGRVLQAIHQKGMDSTVNIIVSADHGFITYAGNKSVLSLLLQNHLKNDSLSRDVVLTEGAIYVKDHNRQKIEQIVQLLQQQSWVGAIFTRGRTPTDTKGWVPGTLSFSAVHWDHPRRTADILVDDQWNDNKNATGYSGTALTEGIAGHGGSSPYEIHIALLAKGPDFKSAYSSDLPTSNVDIVPTLLHIHHLPVPSAMDGRVMHELLANDSSAINQSFRKETIQVASGKYRLTLHQSVWGKYKYVDFIQARHR
jgi:predicted AlkP superfamily pyrophosphatase or phosphodiesterase